MKRADELRIEIANKLAYLQLCSSIMKDMPGQSFFSQVKRATTLMSDFIINEDDTTILNKAPEILSLIAPIIQTATAIYPPKTSIADVATSYNTYCRNNPNLFSEFGYNYGWLQKQIDCKRLYSQAIPAHSKVGTFYNAGKFIIEESIILRDAFFFMILAEKELQKLDAFAKEYSESNKEANKIELNRASVFNANVGTFCRTGLLNFYSFIEAYVNGIGLDYLFLNEHTLTEKEKEALQGKDGKSYLSLEKKLEKFHRIIRPDKKTVFVTTSKEQLKEPFITFLNECKQIRNAAVHYSATKEPIVRKPHDWMNKLTNYAKITLDVAKRFWVACYENKSYPDYLDLLDYEVLRKLAVKRYEGIAH